MSINKHIKISLNIPNIKKVALFISVFILPLNIFLVARPEWSYWQGHFIDYWAPKLYLSVLFIWFLWGIEAFWAVTTRGKRILRSFFRRFSQPPSLSLSTLLVSGLILRQFFTPHPWPAFVWFATLLLGPILLAAYLWNRKTDFPLVSTAVLMSTVLQAILGIYQYLFQSPLAPYPLLGEPSFSSQHEMATSFFSQSVTILPYGSTPHPNVLAAWMLLGLATLWLNRKRIHPGVQGIFFALLFSTLILTESISAWLSLGWFVFIWVLSKKTTPSKLQKRILWMVSLALVIVLTLGIWLLPAQTFSKTRKLVAENSLVRRQKLLEIGFREIPLHPWGTGWNQHLSTYSPLDRAHLQYGFIQPIHNILVIFVIENGFWILLLFYVFWNKGYFNYSKENPLIFAIIPILCLDHYLYTHIQGQYIVVLILYFLFYKNSK